MKKDTDRIHALEELIVKYQKSYYDGEAEISDGEFDLLWDELKGIAPDSPVLKKVGEGETTTGTHTVDGFPKAKHIMPMGSQDKAANPEEFRTWAQKQRSTEFLVQYKLDGASLELQYKRGKLFQAITRGDGIIGDEITANARRMTGVPDKLDIPFSGGVRGEVVMTRTTWKKKYASKANCRNAANGIMRRKDGAGCEDLVLITYDVMDDKNDNFFSGEAQKIDWLKKRGFKTTVTTVCKSVEDIIAYREKIAQTRDKIPIDIDGLVIKDTVSDAVDLRRARPEKQIAFKFELETAFSILRQVEWSESGATYTPIGIVDPVHLAGTTVQRANLNNPDMIRSMGLKIGSAVSVVKRGEIIPKIEGLAPEGAMPKNLTTEYCCPTDSSESTEKEEKKISSLRVPPCPSVVKYSEIEFPVRCSTCGSDLVDAGTRLYCPNAACPKRLLHRLEKWVSVLDIRELGEKLLRQLFDKERVRHIADIYTLNAEELAGYERMGELSAAKVIRHIQTRRELSLAAFVAGFDLEGVAETTMEKVASAGFDTMEKLRRAGVEDLAAVYGLGQITAKVIVDGLKETAAEMDAVLKTDIIGISLPPPEETQPLRGLSFCFTGELASMKRGQAEEKIKALGASAKTSVVKDLSYLVTNDPGSGSGKNKKARELGVQIIDEKQFLALLAGADAPGKTAVPAAQGELF
jgi:DNA ligase (NAD+)